MAPQKSQTSLDAWSGFDYPIEMAAWQTPMQAKTPLSALTLSNGESKAWRPNRGEH
ncbi:hypothetical protein AGR5A_pb0126 [Agrobacterium genomosp. 5 str. CFBP 6626]|nr:hypothetical protein AGR5A_pb0126 [Agrobacterium genomosp. 5 str. CFBP 6626]